MKIDYTDLNQVKKLCGDLNRVAKPGFEYIVVKYPNQANFNIMHKSNIESHTAIYGQFEIITL